MYKTINFDCRYLATGCSFKSLAFSFRIGASTVGLVVKETIAAIWTELQPKYMPLPTKSAFKNIAKNFYETWNFPNVIGTIDGKHVRVRCPQNTGSMFFNYKKYFSVVLQAVVDANYQFIAIDVGGYGKQSDGGTFQASDFYKFLNSRNIEIPEPECLPGTDVKAPYVFLGDEAYPLLPYLLKPYSGKNLPFDEENYNNRLSRARKTVECAFGIINAKWRILSKAIETNIDTADDIIKCICILHNFVMQKDGFERHFTNVEIIPTNNQRGFVGRPTSSATNIRNIFKIFLANNPLNYVQ